MLLITIESAAHSWTSCQASKFSQITDFSWKCKVSIISTRELSTAKDSKLILIQTPLFPKFTYIPWRCHVIAKITAKLLARNTFKSHDVLFIVANSIRFICSMPHHQVTFKSQCRSYHYLSISIKRLITIFIKNDL